MKKHPFYQITPYSQEKNYGAAANELIKHLPDDSWIVVSDIDGFIITPAEHYGDIIHHAIESYPDTGLFTCWSQRTKNPQQAKNGLIDEDGNLRKHRKSAVELMAKEKETFTELKQVISGFWMLFNKKTWEMVGGFHEEGCLRVDNIFSGAILRQGLKIRRINTLLFCHYYRLNEGLHQTKHLQ